MGFVALYCGGVLALAAAIIATGSWVWSGWMLLVAVYFCIQRAAPYRMEPDDARKTFGDAVLMQLMLVLIAALLSGRAGALLITFGVAANYAVIAANGFRMPIAGGWPGNSCYTDQDDTKQLVWLSDIFSTTPIRGERLAISPGDALEVIGCWVLAAEFVLL